MAFWNRKRETRSISSNLANPAGWLSDALATAAAPSGQNVTVEKALGLAPVWAAVSIISEQVGQLPLKVYRLLDDGQRVEARQHRSWRMLHDKPNSHTPADRFWSATVAQLLLYGNAFIDKRRDSNDLVDELFLLDPAAMTIAYNPETGDKQFIYRPPDGRPRVTYTEDRILHIFAESLDGLTGLSVVQMCKAALGAAIARDEFEGGFYARGAVLSGYVKHPNRLSPDAVDNLKSAMSTIYGGSGRSHQTGVFEEGMEYVPVGAALRDLQFVEAQNLTATQIAVMFKLPPNYLGGSSGDSLTYATMESNQTHFALHSIAPRTNAIAKAISTDPAILPQNVFEAEFTLEAMMRGTAQDRANFYKTLVEMKAMTPDEVRSKENMPDLTKAQRDQLNPPPPPQLEPPADQQDQPDAQGNRPPMRVVQ